MTPHFSFAEAVQTTTGLGNVPSPDTGANIGVTAMHMETVRMVLQNKAIHVNSWYRSPAVNKKVGGSPTSAHMSGFAVDFTCPDFGDCYEVAHAIEQADIDFDQLILEYGWVHISFDPRMRRECLTKKSAASPYQKGLVK